MLTEYEFVENYQGLPIYKNPEDGTFHLGHLYTGHEIIDGVKEQINVLLQKRAARAPFIPDGAEVIFDLARGDCLKINGELYTIQTLGNAPDDHKDLEGQEFIYVNNSRGSKYAESEILRQLFTGRIQDAVEAIRSGEGDLVQGINILGMHSEHVIRFLDREVGERLRAEVIKGFTDTKFGTCLRIFFNAGWGSEYDVGEGDKLVNGKWMERVTPKLFATEDEAHEYAEQLKKKVQEEVAKFSDDYEILDYLDSVDDEFGLVAQCVSSEWRRLMNKEEEARSTSYYFEICQCLIEA